MRYGHNTIRMVKAYILMKAATGIVLELPTSLGGFNGEEIPQAAINAKLTILNLPVRSERVYYHDLLERLTVTLLGGVSEDDAASKEIIEAYRSRIGGGVEAQPGGVMIALAIKTITSAFMVVGRRLKRQKEQKLLRCGRRRRPRS